MKKIIITKEDKEVMAEWITKHGACRFDTKNQDIILFDGGLFGIETEKIMLPKTVGMKKLPNGMSQVLFSKKKYPAEMLFARLWMCELDNTISYLRSMKKMLNKMRIRTSLKKS